MTNRAGSAERRKSKGFELYQRIDGGHYQSLNMSERGLTGRHSRVSPSPGRGTTLAYSPCPLTDPDDFMNMAGNVLAIPLSAIQTDTAASVKLALAPGVCR